VNRNLSLRPFADTRPVRPSPAPLSLAAAICLFGLNSEAALAPVMGVLVEMPVMLSAVWIVKAARG